MSETEIPDDVRALANLFLQSCHRHKILAATAESCTGGLIIAAMTDIPGSSSMVDRGFVTYSNSSKTRPCLNDIVYSSLQ